MEDFGGEALFLAQQAKQQVFGTNVLVREALGFLGPIGEHALAFVAERQIDRSGYLFPRRCMPFDLFADRLDGGVRAQKTVRQRLILTQQAQQQVFRLDIRTAELAGLIAGKEDYPSRLLRVSLKHGICEAPLIFKIT